MALRSVLALAFFVGLGVLGCAQAQSAPTQAPPAAAKATEPAKPAAAPTSAATATAAQTKATAPTVAPTPKLAFPEKGKTITIIVPFDAGGAVDISGRVLAAEMEKELGVPVQILNKPGAATQVGMTALVQSKPDGYTLAYTGSTYMNVYLDPARKAVYDGKNLQPVANYAFDAIVLVVRPDSPFKSPKDVIDAAKANPEKVKFGTTGIAGAPHMAAILLEMATGAKFAFVHFSGGAPSSTALLSGNVDVSAGTVPEYLSLVKSGQIRALAIMDKEESAYYPGLKTLAAQGFDVTFGISRCFLAPAGTPMEIVNLLSATVKKVMSTEEHKKKATELGFTLRYMDVAETTKYLADLETQVKPVLAQTAVK